MAVKGYKWRAFIDDKEEDTKIGKMFTANIVNWRAFKYSKEADNGLNETAFVLQWRSFINNKEEDKNLQKMFTVRQVHWARI